MAHEEERMNNLNSVLIEGTLRRDPRMVIEDNGKTITEFSISSERNYKRDDQYHKEVSLFDIHVFGKQAQACSEHLTEGRNVRIVGRLKQELRGDNGEIKSNVFIFLSKENSYINYSNPLNYFKIVTKFYIRIK